MAHNALLRRCPPRMLTPHHRSNLHRIRNILASSSPLNPLHIIHKHQVKHRS